MTIRIDPDAVTAIMRDVAEEFIQPRFCNLGSGDIAFKIGDDPVTVADKEAESALSARLSGLLKGSKVVGEEDFSANPGVLEVFSGESPVWIIDPIDGTRNFVKGRTDYGIIVALAERNQVIAGWIYDPTSGEVITAERGSGAYYKGRKLKVTLPVPLGEMSGFIGERLLEAYEKNRPSDRSPTFEQSRVSSHEYPRLVIDGPHFGKHKPQIHFRANYVYSTPWDDAAPILIHTEAGGYAAFWDGSAYRPSVMHRGFAVAPDRDSWRVLKEWCQTFTQLP